VRVRIDGGKTAESMKSSLRVWAANADPAGARTDLEREPRMPFSQLDDPSFTLTIRASSAAVQDSDALASSDPTNGTAELEQQWQPIEWSRHSDEKARENPCKVGIRRESCRCFQVSQ